MTLNNDLIKKAVALRMAAQAEADGTMPDVIGYVVGWRAWDVARQPDSDGKVMLQSVTHSYTWVPFEKARAECSVCTSTDTRARDCIPGDACSCGFYAAKSLEHLRTMSYHTYNSEDDDGPVTIVGRLAMWGKVIEGSQGWKAEYAYPEMLFVPFEVAKSLAQPVSNTYGVPVTLLNLLDPAARPGRKRLPVLKPEAADFRPRWMREAFGADDGLDDD